MRLSQSKKESGNETRGSFSNHRRLPAAFLGRAGLRRGVPPRFDGSASRRCAERPTRYWRWGRIVRYPRHSCGHKRCSSGSAGRRPQQYVPVRFGRCGLKQKLCWKHDTFSKPRKLIQQFTRQLPVRCRLLPPYAIGRGCSVEVGTSSAPLVAGLLGFTVSVCRD